MATARNIAILFSAFWLAGCACALDDEDRAAGKPPLWQCVAVNSLKAVACRTQTTDSENCPINPGRRRPESNGATN